MKRKCKLDLRSTMQSIVTKIVISACGVVFLLSLLGSVALIKSEIRLVESFSDEHLEKISQSLEAREQAEKVSLRKTVRSNTDILSRICAIHLNNFDEDMLKQSLRAYLKDPEILAVNVFNTNGDSFAALWKPPGSPEVRGSLSLPEDIPLDERFSVQADCLHKDKKIGSLRVFYTEAILTENIRKIRQEVKVEANTFHESSRERLDLVIINQCLGAGFILLVLMVCLIFLLKAMVVRPLSLLLHTARRLAEFNLTVEVKTDRKDEVGVLLNAMDRMTLAFRKIVSDVKSDGETLADASEQMTLNIVTIASAAEEISISIGNVWNRTREMSRNNETVASAIEEMSSSINELGMNSQQEYASTAEAVKMAERAKQTMTSLGEAANEIGEVTELIKRIADKTSILALNADIEAASAGEAGRGFAVVANEIKGFARQITLATDDISSRISGMQQNTGQAVSVIGDVSDIIHKINASSEKILFMLEEQMKTANEIAYNAVGVNTRINDISLAMEELTKGANEVSKRVGMAAKGGGDEESGDGDDLREMNASAADVARLSRDLLHLVEKFKVR